MRSRDTKDAKPGEDRSKQSANSGGQVDGEQNGGEQDQIIHYQDFTKYLKMIRWTICSKDKPGN